MQNYSWKWWIIKESIKFTYAYRHKLNVVCEKLKQKNIVHMHFRSAQMRDVRLCVCGCDASNFLHTFSNLYVNCKLLYRLMNGIFSAFKVDSILSGWRLRDFFLCRKVDYCLNEYVSYSTRRQILIAVYSETSFIERCRHVVGKKSKWKSFYRSEYTIYPIERIRHILLHFNECGNRW